jgi:hypothetical protein
MHHDQATRDYVARRLTEGKTMGEIARILKRYVAREVFKHLPRPSGAPGRGLARSNRLTPSWLCNE